MTCIAAGVHAARAERARTSCRKRRMESAVRAPGAPSSSACSAAASSRQSDCRADAMVQERERL